MLTLDECIGMSGLTEDEIEVISEHRHLPEIVAVQVGHTLLKTAKGRFVLRGYISDLLAQAKLAGRRDRARHLDNVLTQFMARYPTPRVLGVPAAERPEGKRFSRWMRRSSRRA